MQVSEFCPLRDIVLIEVEEEDDVTESGIIIPDESKFIPQSGWARRVGKYASSVKEGDYVIYEKYAGTDVEFDDGKKYILLSEEDINCVMEN